jgi:hypothetical protein
MYLHTAQSTAGTRLLDDWTKARRLWDYLVAAAPGPVALCVMPTHVQLLHRQPRADQLRTAIGMYARWVNHSRSRVQPLWRHLGEPDYIRADEQRHVERAIHLAPTELVDDPLQWPFSTHLDAVGLSVWPVRPQAHDPARYHRLVADNGLPLRRHRTTEPTLNDVARAVSHLTRTPLVALTTWGPSRTLFIRSARALTHARASEIGAYCQLPTRSVEQIGMTWSPAVRAIDAALFDPRLPGLPAHDELFESAWAA